MTIALPNLEEEIAVHLRAGTLRLHVERADLPLAELCGFASRRSRKRGFVFVSKVLGKHYPVRPSVMAATHERLAAKLADLPGPAAFIALAETATALGQGVYESWLRQSGRDDAVFLHTTRYRLARPLALHFEESHSHATEHVLYKPSDPEARELFQQARSLVLVDDELSTGRTLANLARAYRRVNSQLAAVHLVSLTNWLGWRGRGELGQQIGPALELHSLLEGTFAFEEKEDFDPGPIPNATGAGELKDRYLPRNFGRLGIVGPLQLDLDAILAASGLKPAERILVLGSGEFSYAPFLLARRLEEQGHDVVYQSTTRSPLLLDKDLTSVLEFRDNYHDGIANYVYNVADRRYDRVLIGYETQPLPAEHTLPALLGARMIFFAEAR